MILFLYPLFGNNCPPWAGHIKGELKLDILIKLSVYSVFVWLVYFLIGQIVIIKKKLKFYWNITDFLSLVHG